MKHQFTAIIERGEQFLVATCPYDYAQLEYGVSKKELDRFVRKANKILDAERNAGHLKPFTGKLQRG